MSEPKNSTGQILSQLRECLGPEGFRGLAWVASASAFASLVEVLGMAGVMKFMNLVGNPSQMSSEPFSSIQAVLQVGTPRNFLLCCGGFLMIFLALGKLLNAVSRWHINKFVWAQDGRMARQLLGNYLSRPYGWFLNQNSAFLNRYLNLGELAENLLQPVANILAFLVLTVLILSTLFWVDPTVALLAALGVGFAHFTLVAVTSGPIKRWAEEGTHLLQRRAVMGQEAMSGIKPILSLTCENLYLDKFSSITKRGSELAGWRGMVWELPRYFLEAVALCLILSLTLYFVIWGGQDKLLPMLSLYAMAGYRLIPALHGLFQSISKINSFLPELEIYLAFLKEFPTKEFDASILRIPLKEELSIANLTFSYEGSAMPALNSIDFKLLREESVGIVGQTGSGKSTLVDFLMGLLASDSGKLAIDGTELDQDSLRAWRGSVGYVPQTVFLKDDSILANVAFAESLENIDRQAAEKALETAQLTKLVNSLPNGVDNLIGEDGVRLSGGQRQRLGIARALYYDPEILIFDEATSALDQHTELELLGAIKTLSSQKTTVIVAHRLETVRHCDRIFVLDQGRVEAVGTFDELLETCPAFQKLAGAEG